MRIIITGSTYYPGNNGQAIFTIHLAEGLACAGHTVAVIVPSTGFYYKKEFINQVQIHMVHSVPLGWIHTGTFLNPIPGLQIKTIFNDFKPDILHIQDHYFISLDAVQIAQKMKLPVIGTNHFLPENLLPYIHFLPFPQKFKIAVLWKMMLWTYHRLDLISTPTETAASILRQQILDIPIFPVSCGVDTNWFSALPSINRRALRQTLGLNPEQITILYVGRQDREKRVDLLIRGLALFLQDPRGKAYSGKIQLAIAGQGAAAGEFHNLADSLGIGNDTHFLGYVPAAQLPDLYRISDIFCMPSPEELQSIATLEAMASAKPVIAANARALPELVSHGVNGTLFKPGKAESVADCLDWMVQNQADWPKMGAVSRTRAISHSLDTTILRYIELYNRILRHEPDQRVL